ncbi:MAG: phosphoglycerate kinase [Candidatus Aminicenantes bacterium]
MLFFKDMNVTEKLIFVRVDFNVPMNKKGEITDDTRIAASLPTLKHLLEQKARVIAASHLGRPKGQKVPEFSLKPVAKRLSRLLSQTVEMAPECTGEDVEELKSSLKPGHILLLENLRFHKGEKDNDDDFARRLAAGVDCYINDAFAACHRAHASIVGVPKHVKKSAAGFLLRQEIDYFDRILHAPQKPYLAVLGGAKVADKIPVMENLLNKADDILIGGAMAYTFFAAQGKKTGKSLVEKDKIGTAADILKKAEQKKVNIHLPSDHLVSASIEENSESEVIKGLPIPEDKMGVDIGPKTIEEYGKIISRAKTIFWNGPMGVFEVEPFSTGTLKTAEAIAGTKALSIVGGGDSVSALKKSGMDNKISHVSTGGGAALELIAHETLPGLEALSEK